MTNVVPLNPGSVAAVRFRERIDAAVEDVKAAHARFVDEFFGAMVEAMHAELDSRHVIAVGQVAAAMVIANFTDDLLRKKRELAAKYGIQV